MDKVWQYFDAAGPLVGRTWPITYRTDEAERGCRPCGSFGVRAFTSLVYPHKPQMAAWLNQWAAQFAADTPDCLATATFYPEPDAADYVAAAIEAERGSSRRTCRLADTTRPTQCWTGSGGYRGRPGARRHPLRVRARARRAHRARSPSGACCPGIPGCD